MEATVSSNNVWKQDGDTFWPGNSANNTKLVPPGIYRYVATPVGWFLEKTSSRYTFPYKIYGAHDNILNRVKAAWKGLPASFGVLLNGLKGTGKTITAQQIVNWAIDEGIMVLVVSNPIPLPEILEKVEQPLLVLFDEFEKTHKEDREAQQHLLSALDGLSRNEHRRLFLFTTNTKSINENLIDRPARIRYCWEFFRISNELIEMLLDDLLDPELKSLRGDIVSYLNTREVLTMDVVKTVITECNIFRENPMDFEQFMNLTKKAPAAFKVELVDELGGVTEIASYFRCDQATWLQSAMTKSGQQNFIDTVAARNRTVNLYGAAGQQIEVLGPTDKVDEWICKVQVPTYKTWVGPKLKQRGDDYLWLDERPKEWKAPAWARKVETGAPLTDDEENQLENWSEASTVYGGEAKKARVRFTVDNAPYVYNVQSMMMSD